MAKISQTPGHAGVDFELSASVATAITRGGTAMGATEVRRCTRERWILAYQDALGTPEDDILERSFRSEAEAMTWADDNPVVPLWLETREELIGDNGQILGSIIVPRYDV